MGTLLRLAAAIDRFHQRVGRLTAWLLIAMVGLGAFNALARYLGRAAQVELSSNRYIELQWYLFSLVFLLGAAAALRDGAHVRVDVLFARLSPRRQALVDLLGTLLLLLPFTLLVLVVSWPSIASSWRIRELSPDPDGLPRYPIKSAILVGFTLLALQGLSEVVRCLARLRLIEPGASPAPAPPPAPPGHAA